MKKLLVLAALTLFSSLAVAGSCPKLMKEVDAKLPSAKLNAAQMTEVKKLRADGEALHKSGKHGESVAALNKAKQMLGM